MSIKSGKEAHLAEKNKMPEELQERIKRNKPKQKQKMQYKKMYIAYSIMVVKKLL